jgi:4-amino-4-deoxy-L-arabinose transferase-like glycosyltransferase
VFSFLGVESELGHRLVGAVLGGAVVVLLGLVAWRVAGRTAGLVAAGLGALHPTLVAADGSLMAETLAGAFVLLVVLAGLWVADGPTPGRALVLGLAIGAGALVRGEMLLYLVLVALPLSVLAARRAPDRVRTFLRIGLPAAVGVVVVVLPWTVRNTLLFDEPVLISINDSTVLAGANCDATYGGPSIGSWRIDCIEHTGGTEVEEAAVWREDGLEYIRANRDRLPAVVVARMMRTWGGRDVLSPVAEGRHLGTQTVGNVVWLAVLLPGGVAGAIALARRRRPVELLLLLAPIAAATAVTVLGFGMLRFRHPMELGAVVLTAVATTALLGRRVGAVGDAPADCAPLRT